MLIGSRHKHKYLAGLYERAIIRLFKKFAFWLDTVNIVTAVF